MTHSITLSIMDLIVTLSIMDLTMTLSIKYIQYALTLHRLLCRIMSLFTRKNYVRFPCIVNRLNK